MITRRTAFIGVATSALLITASACSDDMSGTSGGGTSGGQVHVIVVTPYLANAATKESIDDFKKQAEPLGWKVDVSDTAGDMNKLNSAFQDAASQKPAAIVMASGDPTQASLGLKAAKDSNVPVYSMDAAPVDGIAANVTSNNTDLGTKSADALIKQLGGGGNVIMLTHDPHPGVRARAAGAEAELKAKGINVIQKIHIQVPGPVDNARKAVTDAISARGGQINGIWGGWDEPALGATQALNAAHVTNVPVVGVDGQDFALAEIKKGGPFKATVKQDWMGISGKVVELIRDQLAGNKPDKNNYELPGRVEPADAAGETVPGSNGTATS